MPYIGETISLGVAFSWTIGAICIEYASKHLGSNQVSLLRLILAFILIGLLMMFASGCFLPPAADASTWFWMSVSGAIGFLFGDFCLFYAYVVIGSRFGQLFMTLAAPTAAIAGYFVLGESISYLAILGMTITITGIAMSILSRSGKFGKIHFKLPLNGILLGIGAGTGQGVGLVFSKLGMQYYYRSAEAAGGIDDWLIPFGATQMRMAIAIIGFILILLFTKKLHTVKYVAHDGKAAVSIILGTIFGPFLGVAFSLMAVQYTASGVASTIMALTPIIIIIPSVIIFKQKVTIIEIIGAVVSVIGVMMFFV